jgi:hypothetical protein
MNYKLENYETPSDEKVVERWEKIGFTDGIKNEELKLKLSWAYENMAKALVWEEIPDLEHTVLKMECKQWIATVIFPIIRRTVVEYYEKHNEIKLIETQDYIEFFMNSTLSDIIDNDYWNSDYTDNQDFKTNINKTKQIFNKIFDYVDKNTKVIDFDFRKIDMNVINERLEKENPENAYHPEDKYNERRYSCIDIDVEAVFVTMISDLILKELFEK